MPSVFPIFPAAFQNLIPMHPMLHGPRTLAVLGFIFVAGCAPSSVHGVSESAVGWTSSSAGGVSGVDEASVTMVTLKGETPNDTSFVVWSDLSGDSYAHGSSTANRAFYRGSHGGRDGRRVDFQCAIRDGKAPEITIARRSYDLSKGSLFLVSTKQNTLVVAQLHGIDVWNFPRDRDGLQRLARSQPEIGVFFQEHHVEESR